MYTIEAKNTWWQALNTTQRAIILSAVYAQKFARFESTKASFPHSLAYFHLVCSREGYREEGVLTRVDGIEGIFSAKSLKIHLVDTIASEDLHWLRPICEQIEILILEQSAANTLNIADWNKLRELHITNVAASDFNLQVLDCSELLSIQLKNEFSVKPRLWVEIQRCRSLQTCNIQAFELEEIIAERCNNLCSLDLTHLLLTRLDLDRLPTISRLNISQNPITHINISRLHALSWLSCNDSDLQQLPSAYLPNLVELFCQNSALSKIDCSGLKNLRRIEFSYPAQKLLNCSAPEWIVHTAEIFISICNNKTIKTLNLRACPNIRFFDLRGCHHLSDILCARLSQCSIRGLEDTQLHERNKKSFRATSIESAYTRQLYAQDERKKLYESDNLPERQALYYLIAIHQKKITPPKSAILPSEINDRLIRSASYNSSNSIAQLLADCQEAYIGAWVEKDYKERSIGELMQLAKEYKSIDNLQVITAFLQETQRLHIHQQKELSSLTGISYCPKLSFLDIALCPITDISELAECLELQFVSFDSCRTLRDISALSKLAWLEEIHLSACAIDQLQALEKLPYLRRIICSDCPNLPQTEIARFRQLRPDVQIIDYL